MRSIIYLKTALLFVILGMLSSRAWAQEIPCDQDMSVTELPALYFVVDPELDRTERSLIAASGIDGWVEGELSKWRLRFNHMAPGVGLSFDIVYVKAEVLDSDGRVIENLSQSFPSKNECFLLSIFPGGSTVDFDLGPVLAKNLKSRSKLRVRIFVPTH